MNQLNLNAVLLLVAISFSACASIDHKELPGFRISESSLNENIKNFRASNADILFLVMVDRDGKVVQSKTLDWKDEHLDKDTVRKFKGALSRGAEFKPAKDYEPDYREFVYPMNIRFGASLGND